MNMSRFSLLLTVALFVAPVMVIADTTATEQSASATGNQVDPANASTQDQANPAPNAAQDQKPAPDQTKETTGQKVEDAAKTVVGEVSAEGKGIIAAITTFIALRNQNVLDGLDFVANPTINRVLTYLASFPCLQNGLFANNIKPIGRVLVGSALVAAVYAAYKAYVAQQDASNDDEYSYDDAN